MSDIGLKMANRPSARQSVNATILVGIVSVGFVGRDAGLSWIGCFGLSMAYFGLVQLLVMIADLLFEGLKPS